jgi:hypothetical protein
MSKIILFLQSVFTGPGGDGSSKRIEVFWLSVILTVYIFGNKPGEINVLLCQSILVAITGILGVQAVTKT